MKSLILVFVVVIGLLLTILVASFDDASPILGNSPEITLEEAEQELIDSINEAIKEGKDVNVSFEPPTNALLYTRAVGLDSAKALNLLIENGLDIHALNNSKATRLHKAAQCGSVKTAKILLEKGLDVNAVDKNISTPLGYVGYAKRNKKEITELLIKAGAIIEPDDVTKPIPLHYAAYKGNYEVVSVLLDNGANINIKDEHGVTALHDAARVGHSEVVKLLLDRGADVNASNIDGETPLDYAEMSMERKYASQSGKRKAAKLIRQKGGKNGKPQ